MEKSNASNMLDNVLNDMLKDSMPKIGVCKLWEDAILPTRAHMTDAGIDLYACEHSGIDCMTNVITINTGIAVLIPTGYMGIICDRSSMASKGYKVVGGIIDSGYTGEVKIKMIRSCLWDPKDTMKGAKVAQLVLVKIGIHVPVEISKDQLPNTERGDQGFGSTGK